MSAPRPEDGQRFHTELAVNIVRKNLCKTNLRNSKYLTLWTLSIYFRLIVINKTDKLPQTPAIPTNALFSETLPRFPKIFTSKTFTGGKDLEAFLKVMVIYLFEIRNRANWRNPRERPHHLLPSTKLKTLWKAERGLIPPKSFQLPTSFELGIKQYLL